MNRLLSYKRRQQFAPSADRDFPLAGAPAVRCRRTTLVCKTSIETSIETDASIQTSIQMNHRNETVQSFARGLDVLRSFGAERRRQTITEVAERTGMTRAAARRFLYTLCERGFARSDGKHFELTPAVLEISHAYLS